MKGAWQKIHEVFAQYPNVKYELFNEPFGYARNDVQAYLSDMTQLMEGLPRDRCIIDGLGYADDVKSLAAAGWEGDLAYHFYPFWLSEGGRTQAAFSNLLQEALQGVSHRTYITEFGADLSVNQDYETSGENKFGNVNCLRGMHDALLALKG